jgi:hypothetical protein
LYNQALSGAYVAPVGLPDIAQLNTDYNIASNNETDNVVSLALINYASIKPTAITSGYMHVVNGQLYDGAASEEAKSFENIWTGKGPYQTNRLFIAAAPNNTAKNGVLNLLFKPSLFYTNTGNTVSSIEVDFGNGSGFVTAYFNTAINGTYSTVGNKLLLYKITFNNGSVAQCYNTVNVPFIPTGNFASRYGPATTINGIVVPDDVINSPTNAHSGVDLFIRRSTLFNPGSNTIPQFRKPLIVVEGLDLSSAATSLGEEYNYNNFLSEIVDLNKAGFSSGTNPFQPFDQYLDDVAGYDLIFVNWHDGVDDILRNVLAIRAVINYVNARKLPGAEQNVIMGISMGGVVSRYCLAEMVKAGGTGINETQTRLLITHDSPHRGAYVPLALQHLLQGLRKQTVKAFLGAYNKRLDEVVPQLLKVNAAINSGAARDQLLARVIDDNGTVAYNSFLDGPYRNMISFEGTGITPPYRFVATSNGSQCGVPLASPYSQLASINAEGLAVLFGLRLWTGGVTNIDMKSLPNIGQTDRILDFNLKLKVKFLGFNLLKLSMEIQKDAPGNLLLLDGLAGGTRGLGSNIPLVYQNLPAASGGANWFIFAYSYNYSAPSVAPSFTFIPTTSALDITNFNAVNVPYSVAITGLNGSRAANYIAQEQITLAAPVGVTSNVTHTDFYARTCRWLYEEMQNIPQTVNCEDYCSNNNLYSITGTRLVCSNATYTIPNLPPGSIVNWSLASGASVLSLVPSGSQVIVYNNNSGIANTNLIATITSANCTTPIVITKPISADYTNGVSFPYTQESCLFYNVQHPAESGNISYSTPLFLHAGCLIRIDISSILAQGKTVVLNPNSSMIPSFWSVNNGYLLFAMPYLSGGYPVTFNVNGDGACSNKILMIFALSNNGKETNSLPKYLYTFSPNPVNDVLNVSLTNKEEQKENSLAKDYTIKILGFNTNLVLKQIQINKTGTNFKINMAGLKTGYYAVEIKNGDEVQVLKIYKL